MPPEPVPVIGPIAFTARFSGHEHPFDFSDLPCPRLTRHLAQAISEVVGEDNSQKSVRTAHTTVKVVRNFVEFAATAEPDIAEVFDLDDLTPELLEAYECKLQAHFGDESREPYSQMALITMVLRRAGEHRPGAFDVEMEARLGFTSLTAVFAVSKPLDSYPFPVFDAIHAAALADVRRIRDRILEGERLASLGEDVEVGGWDRRENVLRRVADLGPLALPEWEANQVRSRIFKAGGLGWANGSLFLKPQDVMSFWVLLICQTGMEPECVKGLRSDCLINPARGFVSIEYEKRRSHNSSRKTIRVPDGGALHFPGGVIKLALRLTERARNFGGFESLWVDVDHHGRLRESAPRGQRRGVRGGKGWAQGHGLDTLIDRGGKPVSLHLRRLRKTYKSRRYMETAGILDDFATGHTKSVAAAHYADIEAHRELHEDAVENGLREALDQTLSPPVVISEGGDRLDDGEGMMAPEEIQAALSGDLDVWLASCKDYYASPFAVKKGAGCPVAVWGCLECPNAVFTTRHLPSILSFMAFIDEQRGEYSMTEWKVRYGMAFQRIAEGIRPKFSDEQIRTAHAIAEAGGDRLTLPAGFLAAIS